jgi:sorbitol-specific phosphotransferase system component IIC
MAKNKKQDKKDMKQVKGKKFSQRKETLMRVVVGIVTGIILVLWRYFIAALVIVNFVYSLFTAKRLKELAELSEIWNTQWYQFQKYMTFVTNARPFPFTPLAENISKYE